MIAYNPARHKASAPQTRPTANLPFCPANAASSSGIADRNGPRSSSNAIWLAAAAPEAANSSHKSSAAAATRPPPVPNAWSNASRIQSPERRCITCRQTVSTQASTLPPSTQSQPLPGSAIAAGTLSARIVPLVRRIQTEGKPIRMDFMSRPCPISQQEAFSKYLLELEGLDKEALVLMTTEHPFTTNFGPKDVRVTTHYYENNFVSNIFTTLHEGGHALFMQNEPEEFYREHAANSMTNGMHECISRFYENLIGRSEAFVHFIYPKLQELSGGTFADVSERQLYEAVNAAAPGLNRCDADELTYCLHIMIRNELEKAFMNGEITVDEIPALWNQKYQDYLGVTVPDDAQGCLQDVHWTMPAGYFPSYALGSAYGVQILRTMEKDFDVFTCAAKGDLLPIRDWLKAHVFSIASITTPDEWIRAITGESLNPDYFLTYLEEKFSALYELP